MAPPPHPDMRSTTVAARLLCTLDLHNLLLSQLVFPFAQPTLLPRHPFSVADAAAAAATLLLLIPFHSFTTLYFYDITFCVAAVQ